VFIVEITANDKQNTLTKNPLEIRTYLLVLPYHNIGSLDNRDAIYTVPQKHTNFEKVYHEIIKIDFNDIWQKYSKDSRTKY